MSLQCGIIGLANTGKTTLFNCMSNVKAETSRFAFTSNKSNLGMIRVPDPRLAVLEKFQPTEKLVPAVVEIVDIPGLAKGSSEGEGMGNSFLADIRDTDALIHVLRCFENDDIQHVDNKVDPISDAETVETELMLADLESLEKRVPAAAKKAAQGDKESRLVASVLGQALDLLREGKPARLTQPRDEEEARVFRQAQLLTAKPVLYVCNVEEDAAADGNAFSARVFEKAKAEGANAVIVSAAIESELVGMDAEERLVFLEELGLHETGLARVIRSGYELLHLITFFTVGPKEARAWTVHQGAKAPEAAGEIHSDMQRGFIRAETIAYDDYIALGGEQGAKDAGKLRQEGKDYVVNDGDVMHFKFNV